jgi:hypothetical protein
METRKTKKKLFEAFHSKIEFSRPPREAQKEKERQGHKSFGKFSKQNVKPKQNNHKKY